MAFSINICSCFLKPRTLNIERHSSGQQISDLEWNKLLFAYNLSYSSRSLNLLVTLLGLCLVDDRYETSCFSPLLSSSAGSMLVTLLQKTDTSVGTTSA